MTTEQWLEAIHDQIADVVDALSVLVVLSTVIAMATTFTAAAGAFRVLLQGARNRNLIKCLIVGFAVQSSASAEWVDVSDRWVSIYGRYETRDGNGDPIPCEDGVLFRARDNSCTYRLQPFSGTWEGDYSYNGGVWAEFTGTGVAYKMLNIDYGCTTVPELQMWVEPEPVECTWYQTTSPSGPTFPEDIELGGSRFWSGTYAAGVYRVIVHTDEFLPHACGTVELNGVEVGSHDELHEIEFGGGTLEIEVINSCHESLGVNDVYIEYCNTGQPMGTVDGSENAEAIAFVESLPSPGEADGQGCVMGVYYQFHRLEPIGDYGEGCTMLSGEPVTVGQVPAGAFQVTSFGSITCPDNGWSVPAGTYRIFYRSVQSECEYCGLNCDGCEPYQDIDGDGILNSGDDDNDNDGVADDCDADAPCGSGSVNGCLQNGDADGDGIMNSCDPDGDIDGDGEPDESDATPYGDGCGDPGDCGPAGDADGDGVRNDAETDADGDGNDNSIDATPYGDGCGAPGSCGPAGDADGDDIRNDVESDADGDEIPNNEDSTPYGDSCGIPDKCSPEGDADGDGIRNDAEDDADDDGIDNEEDDTPYGRCDDCEWALDELKLSGAIKEEDGEWFYDANATYPPVEDGPEPDWKSLSEPNDFDWNVWDDELAETFDAGGCDFDDDDCINRDDLSPFDPEIGCGCQFSIGDKVEAIELALIKWAFNIQDRPREWMREGDDEGEWMLDDDDFFVIPKAGEVQPFEITIPLDTLKAGKKLEVTFRFLPQPADFAEYGASVMSAVQVVRDLLIWFRRFMIAWAGYLVILRIVDDLSFTSTPLSTSV